MSSVKSNPSLSPSLNYVLAALSAADFREIEPFLKPCLFHLGHTFYEKGDTVDEVFFPKTGVISQVLTSEAGVDVEVGLIGREGSLGTMEVLGRHVMMMRAIVQIAGSGWKMSAAALLEEFSRNRALQTTILRSAHSLSQQTAQCVLCNRLHTVEKRLARWLLMCQDRMHLDTLDLTQEFIGNMLGTRRVGVTLAAGVLRDAGVIEYTRGRVTITNRAGLEKRSCECYSLIRESFDTLVPSDLKSPSDS